LLYPDQELYQYITCVQSFYENFFVDFIEMYFIILGSIILGIFVWFLLKKDPEPMLDVYSQPGIIMISVVSTA